MAKTASYTMRAIKNYQDKKDRITLLADKGTKERLKAVIDAIEAKEGKELSSNTYILGLVYDQLEKDEEKYKDIIKQQPANQM